MYGDSTAVIETLIWGSKEATALTWPILPAAINPSTPWFQYWPTQLDSARVLVPDPLLESYLRGGGPFI